MEPPIWKTSDFNSACVLRAIGTPLHCLTFEGKQVYFLFEASPESCEKIIAEHWDGKVTVDTRKFIQTTKELKTRLYELKLNHDKH